VTTQQQHYSHRGTSASRPGGPSNGGRTRRLDASGQPLAQETIFVPPASMFVLGALGILVGIVANLWQMFTSFSAFQHIFVTGTIYTHMAIADQNKALPVVTIICALISIAFQLAILYLVFRVDRTWKHIRAQGSGIGRARDAAKHTAVEVMHHVPLLLIWGVIGFIADTVGDYTFLSIYSTDPFLQFMYGAALYASSTIMLVGAIEFIWAGMISYEKFKAWKLSLEEAARKQSRH
jgi:hypothetical protein